MLKIDILIYQITHVPFGPMIKAVMCPIQLHFMTPTLASSIQRRLISKRRMSEPGVDQKVNPSVGQSPRLQYVFMYSSYSGLFYLYQGHLLCLSVKIFDNVDRSAIESSCMTHDVCVGLHLLPALY